MPGLADSHEALVTEFAKRQVARDQSPFTPAPLPSLPDITAWLTDFPDHAMRGVGLADRSVIALWDLQRQLHPQRRVYIWSLDEALVGYDSA